MKIDIKGIVRNTPPVNAKDGELDEVINLRPKDGAWRPIPARSAIFSGLPYTNVYVHSNSGYKHYLGLKSTGEFEYFAEDIDGVPTELPVPILVATLSNPTFTQIGNVININDAGLKHLVWYDNAYMVINSDFDGAQDDLNLICNNVDFKVDEVTDNNGHREMVTYFTDALFKYDDFADANKSENLKAREESAKAIMIKALGKEASEGYLHGYLLACAAIELYDGSFIQHSNPVLLGHVHDTGLRYSGLVIDSVSRSYNGNKASFNVENHNRIPYEDGRYIEHVDTVKAYVAYNSGEKYKNTTLNPGLIAAFRYIGTQSILAPNHEQQVWVSVMRNKLSYKVKNSFSEYLRPLIKSISLFITPQVQLYDLTDVIRSTNIKYAQSTDGVTDLDLILENFSGNIKENGTIIKELGESKVFYKVHEIPFDDIVAGTWKPIDLKDKLGDLLLTREKLDYDNFSHHKILPEVQFVYNSKLHIGDYKTIISRGFPIPSFNYNGGIGQFQNYKSGRLYNGYIETSLKLTTGDCKVVRYFNSYDSVEAYSGLLNPMLSYPDNRAYKMKVFVQIITNDGINGATQYEFISKEFDLIPSDFHNFSYYVDSNLKPIGYFVGTASPQEITIPAEVNTEQIYPNVIKVSEINNPFIFPVENTYQVGNGNIIALATNTIALSTGQFGEYPVYVFCSDGIFALNVGGGEVNYSSSRPVSREVCVNKHVKSVDYGVVFMTSRGACIISGAEVREISEPLRGDYFDVSKTAQFKKRISHNQLVQLLPEITGESIADYMKDAVIGYNYMDKEVWFTNPNKSYSYVFSRGVWFKVKQTGQLYVDDYPKQYILNSGYLIDIASETGTATETAFLTRPMKMGDNFKQLFTAIIRSTLIVEDKYKFIGQNYYKIIGQNYVIDYLKYAGIYVFGSYDGQRWGFLGGCEKRSEINDLGTRVERTDCKYFRVGFVGNIKNESTIQFMEFEGGKSILADKLR